MKVFYWNIRGLGNLDSRLVLKNFCDSHHPDLLSVAEPFVSQDQIPSSFWNGLKLKTFVINDKGSLLPNLWGICANSLDPIVVSVSKQHVTYSVVVDNQMLFISAIYACTTHVLRRELWLELANLQANNPAPWIFIGDFNAVLGSHVKRGGCPPLKISCDEFSAWSGSCKLSHLVT